MQLLSSHIETCVNVRTSDGIGTCFFRKLGPKGAFVSAAHLFSGVKVGDSVYFKASNDWRQVTVAELYLHPLGDDVCAFTTEEVRWKAPEAEIRPPELLPGDAVRFLGFPHALENTYPSDVGLATPLVRHAHLSGAIAEGGRVLTVFDGFNNPGYSGGPIYAALRDGTPTLVSVVSGYRPELREKSMVYRDEGDGRARPLPDLFVKPNSGMIHGVILASITEVFEKITTTNAHND